MYIVASCHRLPTKCGKRLTQHKKSSKIVQKKKCLSGKYPTVNCQRESGSIEKEKKLRQIIHKCNFYFAIVQFQLIRALINCVIFICIVLYVNLILVLCSIK